MTSTRLFTFINLDFLISKINVLVTIQVLSQCHIILESFVIVFPHKPRRLFCYDHTNNINHNQLYLEPKLKFGDWLMVAEKRYF